LPAGLVVVDHRDVPGKNVISLIEDDQPCLAVDRIRHAEEPVLLLAHADREALLSIEPTVLMQPESPVFDPLRSPRTFKQITIRKGDALAALGRPRWCWRVNTGPAIRSTPTSSPTA
jgi:xanthine dehydrogenase molybdopterin-binding subunit B